MDMTSAVVAILQKMEGQIETLRKRAENSPEALREIADLEAAIQEIIKISGEYSE